MKVIGKFIGFLIFIVLLCGIIIAGLYIYCENQRKKILMNVGSTFLSVNKYYVYGTHFNLDGMIDYEEIEGFKNINLALMDINQNEKNFDLIYEIDDDIVYIKISEFINQGISLEDIEQGRYYLFVKVEYSDETCKYISLENNTDYSEIEYYTISNNGYNNRITIDFYTYKSDNGEIPYLKVISEKVKLPTSVYDIAIDPGHGGSDPGAVSGKYKESELAMEYSNLLKNSLEEMGLKVILTRDGTEDTSSESDFSVYSVYDFDGRVNIVGRSRAKYNFSIHLNSLDVNTISGTEIYAPNNANLDFAQALADNIVLTAKTTYSTRTIDKVSDGVYVRTFTEEEIEESNKNAKKDGYQPYDITTDTPYLYMIREVGGCITNAYIDGRNTRYGTNLYYNSNIGVESYLIELGYINNKKDLNNMLNNKEGYIKAITDVVREFIIKD